MTARGRAPAWLNDPVRTVPVFSYAPLIVGLMLLAVVGRIFWRARRDGRRRRMIAAGCVAVGIVLLGSFIAWQRTHVQRGPSPDQVAALNRLGFPLELPSVPGYFAMGGFVLSGNSLLIGMGRGRRANLASGQTQSSVLSVRFYPTSDSEGASDLRTWPRNSLNHRPTIALFSSTDIITSSSGASAKRTLLGTHPADADQLRSARSPPKISATAEALVGRTPLRQAPQPPYLADLRFRPVPSPPPRPKRPAVPA